MNDEPPAAIRMAGRTLRPIGKVTVWIITALAIAACSSDHSDDPTPAAATSGRQAVTTSAPSPTATPTTLKTTTVTAAGEPTEPTTPSPPIVTVVPVTDTPTSLETTLTVTPTTVTGHYTGPDHVAVAYTVPNGWEALDDGWAVIKSGSDPVFGVAFWNVANVFVDPCQWVLFDPPVGPSVDELASAWANVPAVEVTSTATSLSTGTSDETSSSRSPTMTPANACKTGSVSGRTRPARSPTFLTTGPKDPTFISNYGYLTSTAPGS